MNIAIIKYNAGNVQSIEYALNRLGYNATITDNEQQILNADKVIFPGVGNAYSAMESLKQKGLDRVLKMCTKPVLGICVGMQLLCNHSEENDTTGLGIIDLNVKKFISSHPNQKIPHMGWNSIHNLSGDLLKNIDEGSYVYYVHSYYVETGVETIAQTDYILNYSAVIQKNNFYGVQFHTEKSALIGDRILYNFINMI